MKFAKDEVAALMPATLLKKSLCHRCFPVNFAKLLRAPVFTEHLRWLLLINLEIDHHADTCSYSTTKTPN